jgi:hypothetical protein
MWRSRMYIESSDGGTVHWWTQLGPAGDMRVVSDRWSADVDGGGVVEDALFFGLSVYADHGAQAAGAGAATVCEVAGE